jgi:hypothetical protein
MRLVAVLSGITLGLSWVLLFSFFVTDRRILDRISGVLGFVFAPLMLAVVVALHRTYAVDTALVWLVTVIGGVSMVVTFAVNALVVFAQVPFEQVAVAATLAALGTVLWPGAAGWMILEFGRLPATLGWLGLGVVVLMITALVPWVRNTDLLHGRTSPTRLELAAGVPVVMAVPVWLILIGLHF